MNKKTEIFRIVILSFIFATTIGYSLADWVPPAGSPPSNNVPPPINVGAASQIKLGNLGVNNLTAAAKVYSASTAAGDIGTTVVTKDYVDGKDTGLKNYIDAKAMTPGPAGPPGAPGPAGTPPGAGVTYMRAATDYCGGTAFFCSAPGDLTYAYAYNDATSWQFGEWRNGYGAVCRFVLCTQ
jgi:hypothetical protein